MAGTFPKLKRAAFIAAASGYFQASNSSDVKFATKALVWQGRTTREAESRSRMLHLTVDREACEYMRHHLIFEDAIEASADVLGSRAPTFVPPKYEERYLEFFCSAAARVAANEGPKSAGDSPKFRSAENSKGPLAVFG